MCWEHNIKMQKTIFMLETVHHFVNSDNLLPFSFTLGTHGPMSDALTSYLVDKRISPEEWLEMKSRPDLGLGESAHGIVSRLVKSYFSADPREMELLTSEVVKLEAEGFIKKSKYLDLGVSTDSISLFEKNLNEKYESKNIGNFAEDWKLLKKPLEETFIKLRSLGYEYSKILGIGSSAVAFLVEKVKNEQVISHERYKVVKFPRPTQGEFKLSNLRAIKGEADKLAKLHHPNIVSVNHIETIKTGVVGKEDSLMWFLMEYIEGAVDLGEFVDFETPQPHSVQTHGGGLTAFDQVLSSIGKKKPTFNFTFENFIQIFRDVGDGLSYLHSEGIVHLDVKPGNILISRTPNTGVCRAFITDLGYSVYKNFNESAENSSESTKINIRCDYEVAPPFFKNCLEKGYSREGMVYSIGVRELKNYGDLFDLYELGKTMKIIFEKIDHGMVKFGLSDDWIDPYRKRYVYIIIGRLLSNSAFPETNENSEGLNEFSYYLTRVTLESAKQLKFDSASDFVIELDKMNARVALISLLPEASIMENETIRLLNVGGSQLMAPLSNRVKKIVDHVKFARLSNVSQLGFVRLVFPGAIGTRFEHSIGVYLLTIQYIIALWNDNLNPMFKSVMRKQDLELAILAALLHDVGYFPMAHDLEDTHFINPKETHSGLKLHEQIGLDVIPQFKDVMSGEWSVSVEDVYSLLSGDESNYKNNEFRWKIIRSLISGVIDSDKLDYVYRDCRHLGLPYAEGIDRSQMIRNLTLEYSENTDIIQNDRKKEIQDGPEIAVKEKGRIAAEMLSFARYAMFSVAYWHHTVRILKRMLSFVVEKIPERNKRNVMEFIEQYEKEFDLKQDAEILWGRTLGYSDKSFLLMLKRNTSEEGALMIDCILERKLYKRIKVYNSTEPEFEELQTIDVSHLERKFAGLVEEELKISGKSDAEIHIGIPLVLIDQPIMQKKATLFTVREDNEIRFRALKSNVNELIYDKVLPGLAKIRVLIPYHVWILLKEKQKLDLRDKIAKGISKATSNELRR